MQKITTFLWFDDQAEEAANFYVSLFNDSKIDASTDANKKAGNRLRTHRSLFTVFQALPNGRASAVTSALRNSVS